MTLILDYDIISKETKTNNRAVGGDMLLRQIKYFCTIVEEGSLRRRRRSVLYRNRQFHSRYNLLKRVSVRTYKKRKTDDFLLRMQVNICIGTERHFLEAERICKEVQRIGRDDELILKIAYPKHYSV